MFWLMRSKKSNDSIDDKSPSQKSFNAAQLRMQKDINDLCLPPTISTTFPDANNLMNFKITIAPDEGMYEGGRFEFDFKVGHSYPHEPPKVKCVTNIFHPNIDMDGHVCLNILRNEWSPVLTINSVVYGLQHLLLEPNPDDPINEEAADLLKKNQCQFLARVKYTSNIRITCQSGGKWGK